MFVRVEKKVGLLRLLLVMWRKQLFQQLKYIPPPSVWLRHIAGTLLDTLLGTLLEIYFKFLFDRTIMSS